jgi:type VI secretion system protein ImpL
MLFKEVLRIVLYGIGLGSLACAVYLVGPFISIGGFRPLENPIVRDVVIALIVAAFGAVAAMEVLRRRKGAERIAKGIGGDGKDDSDEPVLKERMKDALATLKTSSGGRANYLYDLPWYVLIGPPGSGKTTALVNSGLKFPLARGGKPAAIAGVGGTRYCDWWFTEDAVLIDTAGRYTTQDSDATADKKSWLAFLDTLKHGRPRQPINGVMVAISVEDLLTLSPAELATHAAAIRARLLELHRHLKVAFPVYALFTKTDLVAGFNEYFQNLGEIGRQRVFGATFQTGDKTRNLVGEVPDEFDALVHRLNEEMPDRLQEEPDPVTRARLYGFPTQMEVLKRPVFDFLDEVFEPTRYHVNATLRGFYFTSGTQQGTPIDQLLGALERSFGATGQSAAPVYSGRGKSFFLTDLIKRVVIGEAAWVSTDRAAVRRAAILKAVAYTVLVLVSVGLAGAWWVSYARNRALIVAADAAVAQYRQQAGALIAQTTVGDHNLDRVLPALASLRQLPDGYAARDQSVPLLATFGLSQHDRLQSAAVTAYHLGLERLFRPRLIFRVEEQLAAQHDDPNAIYPTLKVYMMLGGLQRIDRALVTDWFRTDWTEKLYPGAANEDGRKQLEEHLQAMFDLDSGEKPLVELSSRILEDSQAAIARLSPAQRAYQLLKSQAAGTGPDWLLTRDGGRQVASVFEAAGDENLASIRIPYFYTYAGFQRALVPKLNLVADQLDQEKWVLGTFAHESAYKEKYGTLKADVVDLYSKDYIDAWRNMLAKVRFKAFNGEAGRAALATAASQTSPVKQLLQSVRDETAVTKERPGFEGKPAGAAPSSSTGGLTPAQAVPELTPDKALGSDIEEAFQQYQDVFAGDPPNRPIDVVLQDLNNISADLRTIHENPSAAAQANDKLQEDVNNLSGAAPSLPQPFADMVQHAVLSFSSDVVAAAHATLSQALKEVTSSCKQYIEGKYPFVKGTTSEVGLVDFGRVFGPSGVLDTYFEQYLKKYVDRSKKAWAPINDPVARTLSGTTLQAFQRAADIRNAFFAAGGTQPAFMVTVTPPTASGVTANLEFYGSMVSTQGGSASPTAVQWPGSGNYQVKITVVPQAVAPDPAAAPSLLPAPPPAPPPEPQTLVSKNGVWALFHILDEFNNPPSGRVHYFGAGKDLYYSFSASSAANPLNLTALRAFHCPSGI